MQRENSAVHWLSPDQGSVPSSLDTRTLVLAEEDDLSLPMNDWSFGQLCRLANLEKRTINRLTADTASRVFAETLPRGNKPLQVFALDGQVRSIHGSSYTRLHDAEVLETVLDVADGFDAPPKGFNGATGLYGGEQDMFCFLIDPTGWIDIDGETFAPGFFVWNSGSRAADRRHSDVLVPANLSESHRLGCSRSVRPEAEAHGERPSSAWIDIREAIRRLVAKRDARRDRFAEIVKRAMGEQFEDADEAFKTVIKTGVGQRLARQAVELARQQGRLTIFSMVDALTRLSGKNRSTRVTETQLTNRSVNCWHSPCSEVYPATRT